MKKNMMKEVMTGMLSRTFSRMRNRIKKGFTTAEVLIAVAILAILFAVGTPALMSLQKNLKLKELDDCARQIYLAVQNQLTAVDASGTLETVARGTLTELDANAEIPSSGQWCTKEQLTGKVAGKLFNTPLVQENSIEATVASNSYIVKIDFATGTVLEVLYSEPNKKGQDLGSDKNEANKNAASFADTGENDNNKHLSEDDAKARESNRKNAYIGQYDSSDIFVDGNPDNGVLERSKITYLPVTLEIKDNEDDDGNPDGKLRLKITTTKYDEKKVKNADNFNTILGSKNIKLTVMIQELDAKGKVIDKTSESRKSSGKTIYLTNNDIIGGLSLGTENTDTVSVTLDDLVGKCFKEILEEQTDKSEDTARIASTTSNITPGSDIRITVTASIENDTTAKYGLLTTKSSIETNSLFESINCDGEIPKDEDNNDVKGVTKYQIFISNPRHLQNLDFGTSGVKMSDIKTGEIKNETAETIGTDAKWTIFQIKDIDWAETKNYADNKTGTSLSFKTISLSTTANTVGDDCYMASYISSKVEKTGATTTSTENSNTDNANTKDTAASATEKSYAVIKNLKLDNTTGSTKADATDSYSGLFAKTIGTSTNIIFLKNISLIALNQDSKATRYGGIVGTAKYTNLDNCSIINPVQKTTGAADSSDAYIGGIMGETSGYVTINSCIVTKDKDIEGYNENLDFDQNFKGGIIGGILGFADARNGKVVLSNCTVSNLKQKMEAGAECDVGGMAGFTIGSSGDNSLKAVFTNCNITNTKITVNAEGSGNIPNIGGLVGMATGTTVTNSQLYIDYDGDAATAASDADGRVTASETRCNFYKQYSLTVEGITAEGKAENARIGGLIGRIENTTIESSSASWPSICTYGTKVNVTGGLVGLTVGTSSISSSYADTGLVTVEYDPSDNTKTISSWYTDGTYADKSFIGGIAMDATSASSCAGGLIGSVNGDTTVNNSYSMGYIAQVYNAGGLAGSTGTNGSLTVNKTYAFVDIEKKTSNDTADVSGVTTRYGFAPSTRLNGSYRYWKRSGYIDKAPSANGVNRDFFTCYNQDTTNSNRTAALNFFGITDVTTPLKADDNSFWQRDLDGESVVKGTETIEVDTATPYGTVEETTKEFLFMQATKAVSDSETTWVHHYGDWPFAASTELTLPAPDVNIVDDLEGNVLYADISVKLPDMSKNYEKTNATTDTTTNTQTTTTTLANPQVVGQLTKNGNTYTEELDPVEDWVNFYKDLYADSSSKGALLSLQVVVEEIDEYGKTVYVYTDSEGNQIQCDYDNSLTERADENGDIELIDTDGNIYTPKGTDGKVATPKRWYFKAINVGEASDYNYKTDHERDDNAILLEKSVYGSIESGSDDQSEASAITSTMFYYNYAYEAKKGSLEANTGETKFRIYLDKLSTDEGERFNSVCFGLTPGANIRVTATLLETDINDGYDLKPIQDTYTKTENNNTVTTEKNYSLSTCSDYANSLFAYEKVDGDAPASAETKRDYLTWAITRNSERKENSKNDQNKVITANIKGCRHLQNLDTATSGVNSQEVTATFAYQKATIDWSKACTTKVVGEETERTVMSFNPIINTSLVNYDTGKENGSTGNYYLIKNLKITGCVSGIEENTKQNLYAGLFGYFRGSETNPGEIKGVKLVNPNIKANILTEDLTGDSYAGGLAGRVEYTLVEDCQVYFDAPATETTRSCALNCAAKYTGGLIGYTYGGKYTDNNNNVKWNQQVVTCSASWPLINGAEGFAGGLIGCAEGTYISESYADTGLLESSTSTETSGTGTTTTTNWTWASGLNANSNGIAGGLVGKATLKDGNGIKTEISNCYAMGYIESAARAAGFVGTGEFKAEKCCSYVELSTNIELRKGFTYGTAECTTNLYYWKHSNCFDFDKTYNEEVTDAYPVAREVFTKTEDTQYGKAEWDQWSYVENTKAPYNVTGDEENFKFLSITAVKHYGDWAPARDYRAELEYEYADGSESPDPVILEKKVESEKDYTITKLEDIEFPKGEEHESYKEGDIITINIGSNPNTYIVIPYSQKIIINHVDPETGERSTEIKNMNDEDSPIKYILNTDTEDPGKHDLVIDDSLVGGDIEMIITESLWNLNYNLCLPDGVTLDEVSWPYISTLEGKEEERKNDDNTGYILSNIAYNRVIDLYEPTSDGYKFEGWYTDSSYSEASKVADPYTLQWTDPKSGDPSATYTEDNVVLKDVTLYAKWSASDQNTHKVEVYNSSTTPFYTSWPVHETPWDSTTEGLSPLNERLLDGTTVLKPNMVTVIADGGIQTGYEATSETDLRTAHGDAYYNYILDTDGNVRDIYIPSVTGDTAIVLKQYVVVYDLNEKFHTGDPELDLENQPDIRTLGDPTKETPEEVTYFKLTPPPTEPTDVPKFENQPDVKYEVPEQTSIQDYEFQDKWSPDPAGSDPTVPVGGDYTPPHGTDDPYGSTLYAVWEAETFYITYVYDGGWENGAEKVATRKVEYTIEQVRGKDKTDPTKDNYIELPIPIKEDTVTGEYYTFKGWYRKTDGKTVRPDNFVDEVPQTEKTTEAYKFGTSYTESSTTKYKYDSACEFYGDLILFARFDAKISYEVVNLVTVYPEGSTTGQVKLKSSGTLGATAYEEILPVTSDTIVEEGGATTTIANAKPDGAVTVLNTEVPGYHFEGWREKKGEQYIIDGVTITFKYKEEGAAEATETDIAAKDFYELNATTKQYEIKAEYKTKIANGGVITKSTFVPSRDENSLYEGKTYQACFAANTYTVKYYPNGGVGDPYTQTLTYGVPQNLYPNSFTRYGYLFTGWVDKNDSTKEYKNSQNFANSESLTSANGAVIELNAQWARITCVVTFDYNIPDDELGLDTSKTKPLSTLLKEHGKTEANQLSVNQGDSVKSTLNGMSFSDAEIKQLEEPERLESTTTKEGWAFTGWYIVKDDGHLGAKYNITTEVTDNLALRAVWVKKYIVEFYENKSFWTDTPATEEAEAKYYLEDYQLVRPDSKIENEPCPDPTKTGYTFAGWFKSSDGTDEWNFDNRKLSASELNFPQYNKLKLYAHWTINQYKVSYDLNGVAATVAQGSSIASVTVNYNGTISSKPIVTAPASLNKVFAGWYTSKTGGDKWVFDDESGTAGSGTKVTKNVVLYARWTDYYTVTFDTLGYGTEPADQHIAPDGKVTEPSPAPTAAPRVLDGWYTGTKDSTGKVTFVKKWDFSTDTVTGNLVLYAKWNYLTVKFDALDYATNPEDQIVAPTNGYATEPSPAPTAGGWHFDGWYSGTKSEAGVVSYGSKWVFTTQVTEDMTLYAKWTQYHTVTFDNCGYGTKPDNKVVLDESTVENPGNLESNGKTFAGWYTKNGTAWGTAWDFSSAVTSDLTLYARWQYKVYIASDLHGKHDPICVDINTSFYLGNQGGYLAAGQYNANGATECTSFGEIQNTDTYNNSDNADYWAYWLGDDGSGITVKVEGTEQAKWKRTTASTGYNSGIFAEVKSQGVYYGYEYYSGVVHKYYYNDRHYPYTRHEMEVTRNYVNGIYIPEVTGDTTIYLNYNNNSYRDKYVTVSFDLGDAKTVTGVSETPASQTVLSGSSVTKPANPTCPGKTFTGWKNGSTEWKFTGETNPTKATSDVTLTAQWTDNVESYTVTFDFNGYGGTNTSQTVAVNDYAYMPDPVQSGMKFDGWYENESNWTTKWTFTNGKSSSTVTKDVTLHARWQCRVTVISDKHGTHYSDYFDIGSSFCLHYNKYYINTTGSSFADIKNENSWVDKDNGYSIYVDGVLQQGTSASTGLSGGRVLKTNQENFVSSHYTDTDKYYCYTWCYDRINSHERNSLNGLYFNSVTKDTTIILNYTNYDPTMYSVKFYLNLSDTDKAKCTPNTYPELSIGNGQSVPKPTDPVCTGKVFLGWYTAATGGTKWIFEGETGTSTKVSGETPLYAHWDDVQKYNVTFNLGELEGKASAIAKQEIESGKTATEPSTAPSYDGYTFSGWYEESGCTNKFNFNKPITQATTVYAKWTRITHKVSFVTDYGETPEPVTVNWGEKLVLPADPTSADKIFVGWYTDAERTVAFDKDELIKSDKTLYAKWATKYTVNFVTEHGTTPATQTLAEGSYATEPDPAPTCTGYTLTGWYTDKACTETSKFNFTATQITENKTLYAGWTKNQYTVTFNLNGKAATPVPTAATVAYGDTVAEPAAPACTGFTFTGWYEESACTNKYNFAKKITGNKTLYAGWSLTSVTVDFVTAYGTAPDSQNVALNGKVTAVNDPTQEGYLFLGWYADSNYADGTGWHKAGYKQGTKWNFTSDEVTTDKIDANGILHLYAKWVFVPSVKFDVTSETDNDYNTYFESKYYATTYNEDTDTYTWTITPLPASVSSTGDPKWTVWEGKTMPNPEPMFDYWYLNRTSKTPTVTGNTERDYYTYNGTINANTSDTIGNTFTIKYSDSITKQSEIKIENGVILVPTPLDANKDKAKEHYRQDEIMLHPRWEMTVVLHWNDASLHGGTETVKTYIVDYGDTLPSNVDPVISTWHVDHWEDMSGNKFDGGRTSLAGMVVTSSLELRVIWNTDNDYYIDYLPYDPNAAGIIATQYTGSMQSDPHPVTEVSGVKLKKNTFTRSGYAFVNWKDSEGTEYGDEQDLTDFLTANPPKVNEHFVFTAQWGNALTYTATFIPGENTACEYTSKTFTIEQAIPFPTVTRDGYIFKGWKLVAPVGQVAETYYAGTGWVENIGHTYTDNSIPAGKWGNVTFEAQWEKIPGVDIAVYGDEIDGSNTDAGETRKNRLTADIAIPQFDAKGTTYTISVKVYELDASGNRAKNSEGQVITDTITEDINGSTLSYTGNALNTTVLLDSMEPGKQFKDICPNVTNGANIEVECVLKATSGTVVTYRYDSVKTSSLFAYDHSDGATNSAAVAKIANPRHLQNLDTSYAGITSTTEKPVATSAVQYADINWSSNTTNTFSPINNINLTAYNGNSKTISAIPVTNDAGNAGLFGTVGGSTAQNLTVSSLTLKNCSFTGDIAGGVAAVVEENGTLTVDGVSFANCSVSSNAAANSYAGGIAGYVKGTLNLNNTVTLNAYTVSATGGTTATAAGTVVGFCSGTLNLAADSTTKINNSVVTADGTGVNAGGIAGCVTNGAALNKVIMDETSVTATGGNAGGVIGSSTGAVTISNTCLTSDTLYITASNSGNAGGLIGAANSGVTVSNSSASMLVSAANGNAGGLVGYHAAGDLTITNSYSGGHTVNGTGKYNSSDEPSAFNVYGGSNAGGLVGYTGGTNLSITNSFSTTSVSGGSTAGGAIGYLDSTNATLNLVYVLGRVRGVPVNNTNNGYTTTTYAGLIGKLGTGYNASHKVKVSDDAGNPKCFYLAEVYSDFSYVSESGIDMSTVAYVGGCDPTSTSAPDPLTSIVRLAYYQSTGDVATELKTDPTAAVYVNSYDKLLRKYDYPYKVWTVGATSTVHTFNGDWQPVLNPALEPITLTFLYMHPGTGKEVDTEIPVVLRQQDIVRSNDNTVVVPETPDFKLYQTKNWQIATYNQLDDTYTSLAEYPELSGKITIGADIATQDLYVIKYYERKSNTENQSTIFFMYNPDPSDEDLPLKDYTDLGQVVVDNNTTYGEVSKQTGYKEKEILGYYFEYWYYLDEDGNEVRVDFKNDSESKVTGDMVVYAHYSKNAYYEVTVNFVYQIGDNNQKPEVTNVSRIPGSRSKYTIKLATGTTKEFEVDVPIFADYPITSIYAENEDESDTVNTISPEYPNAITGYTQDDDGKMTSGTKVKLNVSSASSFMVIYTVKAEQPFVVKYVMGHTDKDGNYSDTETSTFYYTDNEVGNYISSSPSSARIYYSLNDLGDTVPSFSHMNPTGSYCKTATSSIQYKTEGGKIYTETVGSVENCRVVELEYDRRQYVIEYNYDGGTAATDTNDETIYARRLYYGQTIAVPVDKTKATGTASEIPANTAPSKQGYILSTDKPWIITATETSSSGETIQNEYSVGDPMPACKVVAKANWKPEKSNFKVVYMFQNAPAGDDGYSYYKTYPETGTYQAETDSKVYAKDYTTLASSDSYAKHFDYIESPGVEGYTGNVTVTADGTAVLEVYFKRQTHTVKWISTSSSYTSSSYTGKYGEDVSDKWPRDANGNNTSWKVGSSGSSVYQANIGILDKNYTFYSTSQGSAKGYYYLEVLDTDISTKNYDYQYPTSNSVYYDLDHIDTGFGTSFSITTDDAYPIEGFTFNILKTSRGSTATYSQIKNGNYGYNGAYFFYLRNDYSLDFAAGYPVTTNNASYTVQYQAPLTKYNSDTMIKTLASTLGVDMNHYDFIGWYQDPELKEKFDFGTTTDPTTMPHDNLKLYGKWQGKTQTVTLQLDSTKGESFPDGSTQKVITCEYGKSIEKEIQKDEYQPQRNGYTFNYWSKDPENNQPFSESEIITSDLTLYPGTWMIDTVTEKRTVTVRYIYQKPTETGTEDVEVAKSTTVEGYIDEVIRLKAVDNLSSYIPKLLGMDYTITSDDPQVVTFYYDTYQGWSYTLNYRATFESQLDVATLPETVKSKITTEAGAISAKGTEVSYLLSSQDETAINQYEIVEAHLPEALRDYSVTGYKFTYVSNDGAEKVITEQSGTAAAINPPSDYDATKGKLVLEFYIRPDYSSIELPDQNVLYNGQDQNNTMIPSDAYVPSTGGGVSSGITEITPLMYVQTLDENPAKDVGLYSVHGYYLLKVSPSEGNPTVFLIAEANDANHINLKIRQRTYLFTSGSSEAVYDESQLLANLKITITGDVINPDGVKAYLAEHPDGITFEDLTGAEDETEEERAATERMNALFFPTGEGFNIYSSIESFRKTPGTMQNIFKVTAKDEAYENNYIITSEYGTLTVYSWQYKAEVYYGTTESEASLLKTFDVVNAYADPATQNYLDLINSDTTLSEYIIDHYTVVHRDSSGTDTKDTTAKQYEDEDTGNLCVQFNSATDGTTVVVKCYVTDKPVLVQAPMLMMFAAAAPADDEATEESEDLDNEDMDNEEESEENALPMLTLMAPDLMNVDGLLLENEDEEEAQDKEAADGEGNEYENEEELNEKDAEETVEEAAEENDEERVEENIGENTEEPVNSDAPAAESEESGETSDDAEKIVEGETAASEESEQYEGQAVEAEKEDGAEINSEAGTGAETDASEQSATGEPVTESENGEGGNDSQGTDSEQLDKTSATEEETGTEGTETAEEATETTETNKTTEEVTEPVITDEELDKLEEQLLEQAEAVEESQPAAEQTTEQVTEQQTEGTTDASTTPAEETVENPEKTAEELEQSLEEQVEQQTEQKTEESQTVIDVGEISLDNVMTPVKCTYEDDYEALATLFSDDANLEATLQYQDTSDAESFSVPYGGNLYVKITGLLGELERTYDNFEVIDGIGGIQRYIRITASGEELKNGGDFVLTLKTVGDTAQIETMIINVPTDATAEQAATQNEAVPAEQNGDVVVINNELQ